MNTYSQQIHTPHPMPELFAPAPESYFLVPTRLIADLQDTPLAVGLYSLIARLYLIIQSPIPLSTSDIQRYDPTLSRGAVVRAVSRLMRGGWLAANERAGHKTSYTPTWGYVRGAPLLWSLDARSLGRPRHINALRIDRRLLDTYLGRITSHPAQPALVSRYLTQPLLSLSDVGAYAITLAGYLAPTAALLRYQLVESGRVKPLPDDEIILAVASQRALEEPGGAVLTDKGLYKLGLLPSDQRGQTTRDRPLFFVPPDMIGNMIGSRIGMLIGHDECTDTPSSASPSAPSTSDIDATFIPWNPTNQGIQTSTTPQPPKASNGAGGKQQPPNLEQPGGETEATCLLRAINVRPHVAAELADQPIERVRAAIADGQSRAQVRDLAGWVVALLRDVRDHGWQLTPAAYQFTPDAQAAEFAAPHAPSNDEHAPLEMVQQQPPDVIEADPIAPDDFGVQLQRELRARTYPDLHPIIAGLTAHDDGTTLTLSCSSPAHLPVVRARLLPLIGPVLRELGCTSLFRLAVATPAPARISVRSSLETSSA